MFKNKPTRYEDFATDRRCEVVAVSGGMPGVTIIRWLDDGCEEKIPSDKFEKKFIRI